MSLLAAKKSYSARLDLTAIRHIDPEIDEYLSGRVDENYFRNYLQHRYGNGSSESLDIRIADKTAELKWTSGSRISAEAEIFHKEALACARRKEYQQAVQKWIQAVAANPEDPDYYFNLGIALFEKKNYQEAVENLKKVISLCPIYHRAHLILGTVCLKTRKFADAEVYLKNSIYFNPHNALAHLNLAAVYSILKKYEAGIASFTRAIELSPAEVRAYFGLAKIYSIIGDIDNANKNFRKVIELDNKGVLANHAKRGIISREELKAGNLDEYYSEGYKAFLYGDYSRAVEMYRRYVEAKPEDDYVWAALGEALLRNGSVEQAATAFKHATKINPSKGLYGKQLAIAYDYLNRPQEAVDAAQKATESGKVDSITMCLLGKNLVKLNRVTEAIPVLEQALKSNRTNLSAQINLSIARARNNEIDYAVDALKAIMSSKIDSPLRAEAEKLLAKFRGY
jgi:tetratricopeptide (TPR) repeat protein